MTPTTKKAPAAKQEPKTELISRPRIPRRVWVVVRYPLRGTAPPKIIARFATPTYAVIFRKALIALNPTAETLFRIKEKML